MFGISRRVFGVMAVAAFGCLISGSLVRGDDTPTGTGTITGTVTTKSSTGDTTPVAGAKVMLMAPRGEGAGPTTKPVPQEAPAEGEKHHHAKPIAETTTGSDGTYSFTNIAAGTYNVVAVLKGTGMGHAEATVAAGGSVKVDITLAPHGKKKAASTN